ncbi:putative cell shape-determining protein MreB [Streptomyces sp. Tu6071]|nr:putative cell shape-determining protein MreB [Streptomyces sp. Tu6071]
MPVVLAGALAPAVVLGRGRAPAVVLGRGRAPAVVLGRGPRPRHVLLGRGRAVPGGGSVPEAVRAVPAEPRPGPLRAFGGAGPRDACPRGPGELAARLRVQHLLERLELLDALAGAERHGVERVLGDVDRHPGLAAQPLVEAAQQGAAPGENDAPVHDVTGELGRALVERRLDRVDDRVDRFLDRLAHLARRDHDGLREPGDEVAATDLGVLVVLQVVRRTDGDLDLLGGALAEEEAVLLLDVLDDRVVQLVARDADGLRGDDAAERDDGDLGGAAADVDDHVAGRLVHREPGADRRGHRLLDDVHLPRPGLGRRLDHRAALDPGDTGGHADDDAGAGEVAALVDLDDEVAEHPLRDLEVGDHAVLEGADGDDVPGGAADHLLRFRTDGEDSARIGVDRDDGRLVENDPSAPHVHQRVGGPEVDSHITADERH